MVHSTSAPVVVALTFCPVLPPPASSVSSGAPSLARGDVASSASYTSSVTSLTSGEAFSILSLIVSPAATSMPRSVDSDQPAAAV
jgi:hypothetical protein